GFRKRDWKASRFLTSRDVTYGSRQYTVEATNSDAPTPVCGTPGFEGVRDPMRAKTAAAWFLSVISPLALSAQNGPDNDPNGLRGYVDNVFHHGQVDSVNLYNGLLTVPIAVGPSYPIGPKLTFQLMLAYSSRINEYGHPSGTGSDYVYFPYSGNPALGLGWTFTLGAIKNCGGVCYIGPDGSQRIFDLPVGGSPGYLKTNDGASLMLHDMGD